MGGLVLGAGDAAAAPVAQRPPLARNPYALSTPAATEAVRFGNYVDT